MSSTEMLKDGSNPEGVDPSPALGWTTKDDITDVKIYGSEFSPPVFKIRTHLAFAGIKYQCIKRNPNSQKKGHYQKIPSMTVNGRVVNDSYIIAKNLIPALYPDEKDVAGKWEEKITYGLQLGMEIEAMEDPNCQAPFLKMASLPLFLSSAFGWFLPIGGKGRKIPKMIRERRTKQNDKYGLLKTTVEYLTEFKDEMGEKDYFAGTKAGGVDVSVYATLKAFDQLPIIKQFVEESKVTDWWNRMESTIPDIAADKFEKEAKK